LQVEVHPDDKEKTAFCTPEGLYEFNVMPFGWASNLSQIDKFVVYEYPME